jgi:hypothetical protein
VQTVFVAFFPGHLEQLARVVQVLLDLVQPDYYAFQQLAFTAQFLRAFRVVPDIGIFRECADFGQAFMLGIVVKDTSVILRCVRLGLAVGWRGR